MGNAPPENFEIWKFLNAIFSPSSWLFLKIKSCLIVNGSLFIAYKSKLFIIDSIVLPSYSLG